MKRLLTLCTLLLVLTFVHAGTLLAVSYNLYVAGVQVTSSNASDILGNHRVSYDAYSKTLTIYNCDIEAPAGKSAIVNGIKGLIIEAAGNAVSIINSDESEPALYTTADLTISNYTQSEFLIWNNKGIAIRNEACTLSFNMGSSTINPIVVDGVRGGIVGSSTTAGDAKLVLDQVDMRLISDVGVIFGQKSITTNNVLVSEPSGAYFTDQQLVNQRGQRVTGEAVLKAYIPYGITVAGVEVNNFNCDDVLGDGSVVFSEELNMLLLSNVDLTTSDQSTLYTEREGLTILLKGRNKLEYKGYYPFYYGLECHASTTMINCEHEDNSDAFYPEINEATLTINSTTSAICNYNSSFNIQGTYGDVSLFLYGKQNQILGKGETSNNSIIVQDARVFTGACTKSILSNQSDLTLNGVKIQTPGVTFSPESGALMASDGTLQMGYTEICYDRYPIAVEGVQLNQYYKDDLFGTRRSGTISYDPETHVLFLDSIALYGKYCDAIDLYDDVTIRTRGWVRIEAEDYNSCIYNSEGTTTIETTDIYSLSLMSIKGTALYTEFGLVLRHARLAINSSEASAIYLADEPMIIEKSTINLLGNGKDPTISYCSGLNLSGGTVLIPTTRYDDVNKMFVDKNGEEYTGEIEFYPLDVDNDGNVTGHDVEVLQDFILQRPINPSYNELDINNDGEVSVGDIVMFNMFLESYKAYLNQ